MFEDYDKKKIGLVVLSAVFLIIVLFLIFSSPKEVSNIPVIANKYAVQLEDEQFYIPVDNLTEDKGYVGNTGDIQYMHGSTWTSFHISGIYRGEQFSKAYYVRDENGDYDVLMAIGSGLNPNDGIIQGYIVENFENNTPYAYIYLDEDWRKKVGDTNIIWGKDLDRIKAFEWTKIGNGVYMNRIEDDTARFAADNINIREGGIFVGDITIEDTKEDNNGGWTAIKLE
ncbi:MAG: hypothetical protein KAI53_04425 [Candidatus Aenigmarchaeota archaeon]|nr:hypothetical protein [Candidatus Aenigmarchaeota archaeon]